MFELGSVAEQAHQELGRLASQACDYLIYVGSYAALVKREQRTRDYPQLIFIFIVRSVI